MSQSVKWVGGLADLHPDAVVDEYGRRGFGSLSDEQLFAVAARVVAQPKEAEADSFILHAPLELLARRALLGYVDAGRREAARQRLVWVAATYAAAGETIGRDPRPLPSPGKGVAHLVAALGEGDLDAVDDAAYWLGEHANAADLAPLGDAVIGSLAAAAHASIYLYQLARIAPRSRAAVALLRPLARELGRDPDWTLGWVDDEPAPTGGAGDLAGALLSTPRLGAVGNNFIYPVMHQVDASGVAYDLVHPVIGGDIDLASAGRALSRVAAWSMLQDDPAHAPYGWTHCLTLPQAAAALAPASARPARAVAIAATYVVGFRAALSSGPVPAGYDPAPVGGDAVENLDAPPATAAAAVHHARPDELEIIATELAGRAALHRDAHVAKYTLACLDAAQADAGRERLYLASAAYLGAWWSEQ